jgi:tetratricopeptide (TPR) repeat protein
MLHWRPSAFLLFCLTGWLAYQPHRVSAQESAPSAPAHNSSGLAPKLQKELARALEELRAGSSAEAQKRLQAVLRAAPDDLNANFILGICAAQTNDLAQAKDHWETVLKVSPDHLGALLSIGNALLRESRPAEAALYLSRAVQAQPNAWRAHALLADALLRQGSLEESISHAQLALELGHGHAGEVPLLLARALFSRGDVERASALQRAYFQDHNADPDVTLAVARSVETTFEFVSLIPSSWLPPDVDDVMPSVDPSVPCNVKEVLQKSGQRIQELVTNVDKFTATETVTHESFNKWGFPSPVKKFKFNYVVAVEESRPGVLNVEEYRDGISGLGEFPDGIATRGLPALVFIFHPYYASNFEITCEGLGHWNHEPAWQLYFRQRADRPNRIRVHKLGVLGPSYPSALKGRAWISADSFQIVRLESALVAPLPEIRLVTDRAAIEYGPVHFQSHGLDMWLPRTAEIYYDWIGRRSHRLHRFDNYLLFSVDDKQRISTPKDAPASSGPDTTEPQTP